MVLQLFDFVFSNTDIIQVAKVLAMNYGNMFSYYTNNTRIAFYWGGGNTANHYD